MSALERLALGFKRRVPGLLQTEAAECGLACVGMIAGYHGHHQSLAALRARFPVSMKGATLATLIQVAGQLGLAARPVKAGLGALGLLKLPCILHWEFNHFVVLTAINARSATLIDPASGERTCSLAALSASYTGVALELWPTPQFQETRASAPVRLRELTGRIHGLGGACSQVLLLALALEILTVVQPFFLQWVVDHVLNTSDRDLLTTLALAFALLMVMKQLTSVARGWMLMVMSTTLNLQWRTNVFTHLLRLPVAWFEKRHLGDVVSRFGAVDEIQRTLTTSFLEAVLDGLVMLITLVLMFVYSPPLAGISLGAMTLYGIVRWSGYTPLRNATEAHIVHAAKEQTHFLETVRGVKAIKLFQHQDDRRSRWLSLLVNEINADLRTQKWALFFRTCNGLLFGLSSIVILWLGARLVLDGQFTVGALLAFIVYKTLFDQRVAALLDKLVDVKMLRLQGERLADIVRQAPEPMEDTPQADDMPVRPPVIEVRNLRFRYSPQEPYVLDGVSFRIEPGESVAINGALGRRQVDAHQHPARRPGADGRRRADRRGARPRRRRGLPAPDGWHRIAGRRALCRVPRREHQFLRSAVQPRARCPMCADRRNPRRHPRHADGLQHAGGGHGHGAVRRPEATGAAGARAVQAASRPVPGRSDQPSGYRPGTRGQRGHRAA
ncbi:hypothetical protein LMG26691_04972 [Achromobacter animicus]|nr:hypothetical protein LMG26691_04972 [Achromobacter animicus]